MAIFAGSGARIIAEDLGVVPDFVRESLDALGIPGYKVFRWERDWDVPRPAVPRPAAYPRAVGRDDRDARHRADRDVVGHRRRGRARGVRDAAADRARARTAPPANGAVHPGAPRRHPASALRVGVRPAAHPDPGRLRLARSHQHARHVTDDNWTWRLPWPVDTLADQPDAANERALPARVGGGDRERQDDRNERMQMKNATRELHADPE